MAAPDRAILPKERCCMKGKRVPTLSRIGGKTIQELLEGDSGVLVFKDGVLCLAMGLELESATLDFQEPDIRKVVLHGKNQIIRSLTICEGGELRCPMIDPLIAIGAEICGDQP